MQIIRCFIQLLLHKKNNKQLKYVESFDMTKLLYGKSVENDFLKEVSLFVNIDITLLQFLKKKQNIDS